MVNLISLFKGVWKLQSYEAHTMDGERIYPWGKAARGTLVYGDQNEMSVQIMNESNIYLEKKEPHDSTDVEIRTVFNGYGAYFGHYKIEESYIIHFVTGSLNLSWIGTEQIRLYEIADDILILKSTPMILDGREVIYKLIWKKCIDEAIG
ncbi:lipocalin-like domain-containing protein [Chitinophaga nivalis]|uniref:Lipocalin-like domain-containing protein n=1 Tax=Chitinophaga nivalis TaxID=2991709 RepID=A0ABT3ING3_9BACT|nr:lipocalin-like domain-containing protein [Chitinophaga nivalis]MCW3464782.1 lipocalin-like domain-containing protein [Chitinophaga nivalis]MCW3485527.1 lipocalin-like domain-containing protein [Chitinophaga nivalis]